MFVYQRVHIYNYIYITYITYINQASLLTDVILVSSKNHAADHGNKFISSTTRPGQREAKKRTGKIHHVQIHYFDWAMFNSEL